MNTSRALFCVALLFVAISAFPAEENQVDDVQDEILKASGLECDELENQGKVYIVDTLRKFYYCSVSDSTIAKVDASMNTQTPSCKWTKLTCETGGKTYTLFRHPNDEEAGDKKYLASDSGATFQTVVDKKRKDSGQFFRLISNGSAGTKFLNPNTNQYVRDDGLVLTLGSASSFRVCPVGTPIASC